MATTADVGGGASGRKKWLDPVDVVAGVIITLAVIILIFLPLVLITLSGILIIPLVPIHTTLLFRSSLVLLQRTFALPTQNRMTLGMRVYDHMVHARFVAPNVEAVVERVGVKDPRNGEMRPHIAFDVTGHLECSSSWKRKKKDKWYCCFERGFLEGLGWCVSLL